MVELAPSLLSANFADLRTDIEKLEKSGIKYLHLDVMDGNFVPNISFGQGVISAIRKHTKMIFDTHLMIENPDKYIDDFQKAGCDIITVHYEACNHLHKVVHDIKSRGIKAGVSINPHTSIDLLYDIIQDLDLVLLMSVNPGFGGQKFIESSFDKLKRLKSLVVSRNSKAKIEIDGGVDLTNAGKLKELGADILVAGSAVFKTENIGQTIKKFKEILNDWCFACSKCRYNRWRVRRWNA